MKRFIALIIIMLVTTAGILAVETDRWTTQPIYVYIPKYGNMGTLMAQAFRSWQLKSKSLVRFKFVNKPDDANIVVEFVDFVSNCNDANAVGCTELAYRGGKYYKAYISIGTKEYVRNYSNGTYRRAIVTRPKNHIYGVMLHEAGHALGLNHSKNKNSIMYPYDLDSMQSLTNEDLRLLYNKYH